MTTSEQIREIEKKWNREKRESDPYTFEDEAIRTLLSIVKRRGDAIDQALEELALVYQDGVFDSRRIYNCIDILTNQRSKAMSHQSSLERQIDGLDQQLADGLISNKEHHEEMRELLRDYRAEAEQSASDAYQAELDRW